MQCYPPSAIVSYQYPTGPSHAQVGAIRLRNGVTVEVWQGGPGNEFLAFLRKTDHIQVCVGSEVSTAAYDTIALVEIAGTEHDLQTWVWGVDGPKGRILK